MKAPALPLSLFLLAAGCNAGPEPRDAAQAGILGLGPTVPKLPARTLPEATLRVEVPKAPGREFPEPTLRIEVPRLPARIDEPAFARDLPGIPSRPGNAVVDGPSPVVDLVADGQNTFRYDTFGNEAFWGGQLRLHESVAEKLAPQLALKLGLKVDVDALPPALVGALRDGVVDLGNPETTLALLKLNAVVGLTGVFDPKEKMTLTGLGVQCAMCHSTVDDSFAPGIGHRQDGFPNRDLDVGAIVALAPTLAPFAQALGTDEETVRRVLTSWGPGRYDAHLLLDGKAFRPDGKTAAALIPAAYGLAGVDVATYTVWGSLTFWNKYVAVTQMHGQGSFFDPRLDDARKFPVAARNRTGHLEVKEDRVAPKLEGLRAYQHSLAAPKPPVGSVDALAAKRGEALFNGVAQCSGCHRGPQLTDANQRLHDAREIGIDSFQADRSPDGKYRTTPLPGLWSRAKGGYYHDGRFATLTDVVRHYETALGFCLSECEEDDLVAYLRSL